MKKFLYSAIIPTFCLTAVLNVFAQQATFNALSKAQHIYGEQIQPSDIKGKVVFLEYWGINCPPCRASIPHLVDAQKKYSKTGNFTVIASHVQNDPQAAKKFCVENKVNFPVFQQFREEAAPCGSGIPSAFIIDHTGKVVEKGHPMDLLKKIEDYIKKAPEKYFMISQTEVKHWKSLVKNLAPNKPVIQILNQLKSASEKDDEKGCEAKALIEEIETYINNKQNTLSQYSETKPAQTYLELQDFLSLIKGLPVEENMSKLNEHLKTDPELIKFCTVLRELKQVQDKLSEKPSKALEKQLDSVKTKIEKFKNSSSPSIAKEAAELIETL